MFQSSQAKEAMASSSDELPGENDAGGTVWSDLGCEVMLACMLKSCFVKIFID